VLVREVVESTGPTLGSGFATLPGPRGVTALYNRVDVARVERVVIEHVTGGRVVREFIERPGILYSEPVGSTQKDS
jgi:(2Fe-2S) ferredoxin